MSRWKPVLLCAALCLALTPRAWAGMRELSSRLNEEDRLFDSQTIQAQDGSSPESKKNWGGRYDGFGNRPAAGIVLVQPEDPDYDAGTPASGAPQDQGWDGSVVRPDLSRQAPAGDRLQAALAAARSQPDPHWQNGLVIQELPAPDLKGAPNSDEPASQASENVRKGAMAVGAGALVFMSLTPLAALGGAALGSLSGVARAGQSDET
jgi:hypothetical protein